jgi:predicted dehydrogenase
MASTSHWKAFTAGIEITSSLPSRPVYLRRPSRGGCQYRAADKNSERREDIYNIDWSDECVYNSQSDIADHTTLLARYAGGVQVSFSVVMGAARTERHIEIVGTAARLTGSFHERWIRVQSLDRSQPLEQFEIEPEGSGHEGGDGHIADEFARLLANPDAQPESTIEASYESALVCSGADLAAREQRVVDVASIR